MNEKLNFFRYLISFYKEETIVVKIYLFLRIIIFPLDFIKEINFIFKNKKPILDIWCWYWISSLYLKYKWFNNKILWVDIDKKRINLLNKNIDRLKFENIKFLERNLISEWFWWLEQYDIALLVDILHHLDLKTQNNLLEFLSKNVETIIIKDINNKPRYKYYWNLFHDKYLMRNKVLCFQWSKKIENYLINLWYKVEYKKVKSIFPYPHYLLIAKK